MNELHRTLLHAAKVDLQRGGVWICNAIGRAEEGLGVEKYSQAALELRSAINKILHNDTLTSWVVDHVKQSCEDDSAFEHFDLMRATRLAWIDYMLENW